AELDDREVHLLERYGWWLMGLQRRWIEPFTDAQRRFVDVFNGLGGAGSLPGITQEYEKLWYKYKWMVVDEIEQKEGYAIEREALLAAIANANAMIDAHRDDENSSERNYWYEVSVDFYEELHKPDK